MAMPISYSYAPPAAPDQPGTGPARANPQQFWNLYGNPATDAATGRGGDYWANLQKQTGEGMPVPVSNGLRLDLLNQQAAEAGKFAAQGQQGYAAYGQQAQGALDALRRQAAGQDSVSQIQLRQALAQQLAQQRSMAAGASPRNAAGAARTAAIQMGRANTAAAGQQSLAGLAERNQANQQYGALVSSLRGQDLQAALQSRANANSGYGAAAGPPQKDAADYALPAGTALFSALAAYSDRALKTNIAPGDDKANAAMAGLRPYTYAYKDQALGAGPQVGVMAQDLQKAGLGQAVVKTPIGLAVDPGKLSGANTAMIAALGRRVAELEGAAAPPTPPLPSLPRSADQEAYFTSPAGQKQRLLSAASKYDPKAVSEQEALDRRRSQNEEFDLRRAGAYPRRINLDAEPGDAARNRVMLDALAARVAGR